MESEKRVKIKLVQSISQTMQGLEIGEYFEADGKHENTIRNYKTNLAMGGKYYTVSRMGNKVRVTRIENKNQ